jgi:hypothetical protein
LCDAEQVAKRIPGIAREKGAVDAAHFRLNSTASRFSKAADLRAVFTGAPQKCQPGRANDPMMKLHLPPDWELPAVFTGRLGDSAGRQRAMTADERDRSNA